MRTGILMLDANGVVQFLNEPAAQMLGVRPGDVVGKPLSSILGDTATLENLIALAQASADRTRNTALQSLNADLTLSVSRLRNCHDHPAAFVCMVRDVMFFPREDGRRAAPAA